MTRDELIARLKGYEWADFECKKARNDVSKDAVGRLGGDLSRIEHRDDIDNVKSFDI